MHDTIANEKSEDNPIEEAIPNSSPDSCLAGRPLLIPGDENFFKDSLAEMDIDHPHGILLKLALITFVECNLLPIKGVHKPF